MRFCFLGQLNSVFLLSKFNQQAMSGNNRKQALGKGLSALLEHAKTDITTSTKYEGEDTPVAGGVNNLRITQIEANPFQPRTNFEKEALIELVESIKQHGIIQPVTVRKMGYDKYQLISGERRFKASQIAGLVSIPAYVRVANDQSMLEMALVENIQRQDLDPMEIAFSYKRLIDECNLTQEALSEKVGKQRSSISNYIRLLKLPDMIQAAIRNRDISFGHARALVNIDDTETRLEIFNRIISEGLSVRQVEDISRWQNKKPFTTPVKVSKKRFTPLSIDDEKVQSDLSAIFQVPVEFKRQPNGKGKLVVKFESEEQLQHILDIFEM